MDLKECDLLGGHQDEHWYYVAKLGALLTCLDREPNRIVDVGAGSGFFARKLLERTGARSAVCVDTGYAADRSDFVGAKPLDFQRSIAADDADLVLLMDVIEHVDDDVELLAHYAGLMKRGTRFVISVPAFPWLWSQHDEFLEHRRRYTRHSLLSVISAARLRPTGSFYFFGSIFPAVVAHRLWHRRRATAHGSDLRRHGAYTNGLLTALCRAECTIARFNHAFGLTAFAMAIKD